MKIFVISVICFSFATAQYVEAHVPNIVIQESLNDVTTIDDPELSQAFYGEMKGFPHTFEITEANPFYLFTQILVPDIETSKDNISGIIIKQKEGSGRVEEVTRLSAKGVEWPVTFEPFGGDSYRQGATFEKEMGAGTYRIEVQTPDNIEKYVLVVGTREEMTLGYFELLGRISDVKTFFGKSKLMVVESSFVYVPLLGLIMLGALIWYIRRRAERRSEHARAQE